MFENAFGLDVSDNSIEVLQLKNKRKVLAYSRVILGSKIIKDSVILSREKLIDKIKEAVEKAKVKGSKVVFGIPESKTFLCFLKDPEDLSKNVPLEKGSFYFDCQKAGSGFLCAASPKAFIDIWSDILKDAGLEPVAFDIESVSLARALNSKIGNRLANSIIVDMGARSTKVAVFNKDLILRTSVVIPQAGDSFTSSIAKNLKVTKEEAEKMKRAYGFNPDTKTAPVLEKQIIPIIEELKEIKKHYKGVKDVFITGGSALIPNIDSYISDKTGLKVSIGESNIDKLKGRLVFFNTALGLALRGLDIKKGINLISEKKNQFSLTPKTLKYSIGAVSLIVLIVLSLSIKSYIFKPVEEVIIEEPEEVIIEEPVVEEPIVEEPVEEEVDVATVKQTPTGWLRVRKGPGTSYSEITKIYPKESYPLLEEDGNWYKIKIDEDTEGWVSSSYVEIE